MALLDGLFKKKYTSNVFCNNCNTHSEVQIPRGITIVQFVESGNCPNCFCNTLVVDYKQIDEFKEKEPRQKIQLLRPRMTIRRPQPQPSQPQQRASVPGPRPSTKPMHYQPLPQPEPEPAPNFDTFGEPTFKPQKIFKQPPVDFWTGQPIHDEEVEEIDIDREDRQNRRRRRR